MLKLNKKYRKSYFGEDVITERVYEDQVWNNTTELVPNAVTNNQISNQAVVFGNGLSRLKFDANLILNHKGGLLGANKLQTYGCNAIFRDHKVDFLVATEREMAFELVANGYARNNIVYTRVLITLEFPNKFYLIPFDPYADAGTTAAYIAAFDGHKKIFMLGFDGQDTPGFNHNIYAGTRGYDAKDATVMDTKWRENQATLFNTYNDVDFVIVSETGRAPFPESWKYITNLRQISFRDLVIEASL